MTNILEKVLVTAEIGDPAGSSLTTEQSNRFIDYMWDATVMLPRVRTHRMKGTTAEIDRIGIGERIVRGAVEAVDTGENAGVTFQKISLTTTKLRLDWEISRETLEDNIEGPGFEDHVARMMTTQAGNDLEDLAINGDVTSTDKLYKNFDGWRKLALAEGVVVDAGGLPLGHLLGARAFKALPRKYRQQRNALRFFSGSNAHMDYLFGLTKRDVQVDVSTRELGPTGAAGYTSTVFGVPLVEVPYFQEDWASTASGGSATNTDLWLTDPQNLIVGIRRDLEVYRQFHQKKDSVEFTVYVRMAVGIELAEALVVVTNVGTSDTIAE